MERKGTQCGLRQPSSSNWRPPQGYFLILRLLDCLVVKVFYCRYFWWVNREASSCLSMSEVLLCALRTLDYLYKVRLGPTLGLWNKSTGLRNMRDKMLFGKCVHSLPKWDWSGCHLLYYVIIKSMCKLRSRYLWPPARLRIITRKTNTTNIVFENVNAFDFCFKLLHISKSEDFIAQTKNWLHKVRWIYPPLQPRLWQEMTLLKEVSNIVLLLNYPWRVTCTFSSIISISHVRTGSHRR